MGISKMDPSHDIRKYTSKRQDGVTRLQNSWVGISRWSVAKHGFLNPGDMRIRIPKSVESKCALGILLVKLGCVHVRHILFLGLSVIIFTYL